MDKKNFGLRQQKPTPPTSMMLAHSQSWLSLPLSWTDDRESTLTQNSEHSLRKIK